jgi:hypothetical protein
MKAIKTALSATTLALIVVASGCTVYPSGHAQVHAHGGPYTCHAYGVGGRHWVITGPNRNNVRARAVEACMNGGGVGCYIPRGGCSPW